MPTGLSVSVDGQLVWKTAGGIFRNLNGNCFSSTGCPMTDVVLTKGNDVSLGPLHVGVVAHGNQVITIDSLVGTAYAAGFLADE